GPLGTEECWNQAVRMVARVLAIVRRQARSTGASPALEASSEITFVSGASTFRTTAARAFIPPSLLVDLTEVPRLRPEEHHRWVRVYGLLVCTSTPADPPDEFSRFPPCFSPNGEHKIVLQSDKPHKPSLDEFLSNGTLSRLHQATSRPRQGAR